MKTSRRSAPRRLARQTADLSLAAPLVVAQRMTRFAQAGARPRHSDRREFAQMGSEKLIAFTQGWYAMWVEYSRVQLQLWHQFFSPTLFQQPFRAASMPSALPLLFTWPASVLSAGLAPVHRKAVSNARRLSRGRR